MTNESASKNKEYKAKSIKVLEGLEAVRKRPAMYIGSTGPQGLHHLVYEIVDNSVDEALAGHCDTIRVTLNKDGSCTVEDNGRGIPTDIHPTEKVSAAQVVLTKLHAGGKFDKDSYKYSGGLHGVGISVVNALSKTLDITIFRNGQQHEQSYKTGKPLAALKVVEDTDKHGTIVTFSPDEKIFQETTTFNFDTLSARLRELAFLNKGLRISIIDDINDKAHEFHFEGGIVSFVEHINRKKSPLFPKIIHFEQEDEKYVAEIAIQYNDGYGEQLFSFVNNINTVEGGTHVSGFKGALTKACNKAAQRLNVLKSGESYGSEDVREGLVAVINIKVPEPQFEGQTKTKLGNSEVKGLVDSWLFAFLETFFEENPAVAKKILQKAESAKRARDAAKKARDLSRRKTVLESTLLPGKLADCSNENPADTELFIVEGDSAGGSAKGARDRANQAILPLRGKILNVEKARLDRILANEEIKALISAIGCGIGKEEFDTEKARYHKIILMTDADVDGAHIRTLLLTFFFRYMKPLIEKGYLYIAQPPLYKAKIGKKERYLKDDKELNSFLFNWATEHAALHVGNKEIETPQWQNFLELIGVYDEALNTASHTFKIAYEQCHGLAAYVSKNPWKKEDGLNSLLENLKKNFKQYAITVEQETAIEQEGIETIPGKTFVVFKILNKQWKVSVEFFSSLQLTKLLDLLDKLELIQNNEWTLSILGKDRSLNGKGVPQLISGISMISKPYMNIQRYKGLGEMNPEQLEETAMNPASRSMLQVTIEDALEADSWFTSLMGDDVGGRKSYIEEYGHFVKNLDV